LLELLFLKNYNITRDEVIVLNKKFNSFLKLECEGSNNKRELMNLFIFCESKLEYIFDITRRFEQFARDTHVDIGFNPGKWRPLLIAKESFD